MQSAFEILSAPQSNPTVKRNSQRDVVMKDIYTIYTSEKQRLLRKKANWKKYCLWLRENKIKHTKVSIEKFRKSKHFIKELPIGTIAIFLARYKVDRLYQILSECKDINNRGGNASGFLITNRFI
jgi:hypothetical protein